MIYSQEVALRCAATLRPKLLAHNLGDDRRLQLKERYKLTRRQTRRLTRAYIDQLLRCQSDEARRILLGVS